MENQLKIFEDSLPVMENQLIKYKKASCQINGATINENISLEEWKEFGRRLKLIEGSTPFWIGDWINFGERKGFYVDRELYDTAEIITGLERGTLQNYKYVTLNIESSRRREQLSFRHHQEVAALTKEKQDEFLDLTIQEKLTARELRELVRRHNVLTHEAELPSEKYRVIYADPPWSYNNSMPSYFKEQANHYSLMSIDELCAMPVKEMALQDAVLFMWVTSPILEESFQVIDAWGFEYKTSFIWDKVKHNMGHYNSVRHELLLLCTRGNCTPDNLKLFDSVQSIERTEHSEKPEEFREIIDTIYPHGSRIELFARKQVKNWNVYGNQLSA